MAKYDEQLSRMAYLMNYDNSLTESKKKSGVEYSTVGADGKVYGIIRENNKYYIKTTEQGKKNIVESYDYINGYNYRNENSYNSYNEATKQLELKMINLNESRGIHKEVSTVDFNRGSKTLAYLTEEARKEIDRVNQIMENSVNIGIASNIGNHGNPESKGTSTGANTKENNKPFEIAADGVKPEKEHTATASDPKKVGDFEKTADADNKLQHADKMEKGKRGDEDYKDTEDDLEGKSVAAQKPAGGKVVKVNESEDWEISDDVLNAFANDDMIYDQLENGNDGFKDGLDLDNTECDPTTGECEEVLQEDDVMDNQGGVERYDADVVPEWERINEEDKIEGDDPVLVGDNGPLKGTSEVLSWDKMNESRIDRITNMVCENFLKKQKRVNESVEEKVMRIVKEEADKLHIWGDHPRYGKEPMTLPANKEKFVGTADRDFNDDSTKGSERYGKKIGNGAPFTDKVDILTDAVVNMVKEALKKNN